ncbi:hypothetical protein OXPF_25370 [Oxobacter pfennigii]|uniref:Uncharacterized protein n=1 Tax=Oxobacter pfennigii TaxID=36849 RepID=A0A0P8YBE6_9CLOT|nr:hypothetical protein [Oxobacter pfennigii]KPU44367.1 hypothetical protein OXPF_25370 [Oxobacter pfennigii]
MDYNLIHADNSEDQKILNTVTDLKKDIFDKILKTFEEQYNGWKVMNIFERQWVFRDFKKNMGQSAEQVLEKLREIDNYIKMNDCPPAIG